MCVWWQSAIAQAQQVRGIYIYNHIYIYTYICVCDCVYVCICKHIQTYFGSDSVGDRAGKEPVAPPSVAAAPWILASTIWRKCQAILYIDVFIVYIHIYIYSILLLIYIYRVGKCFGNFFFRFGFLFDLLFCPFSLLVAAFWSWKLPFQLSHFP